jgi:uncharacterized protein (DUF1697 family)
MPEKNVSHVPTYVGLLKGVNVGGKNNMPMAGLRALFESLGFGEVKTFIQSGNVVFRSAQPPRSTEIEAAIMDGFGIATTVVLRTPKELVKVIKNNPFAQLEGSYLHVGFMAARPKDIDVSNLDREYFSPERFEIVAGEIFLYLPNGMARSKLPRYLDRQLKVQITVRNWNTINRLVALTALRE